MYAYIIRRLLIVPILFFGVTILLFLMIGMLPDDARLALYLRDIPKNPLQSETLMKLYGLRDPIYVQYANWMFGREITDPATGVKEVKGGLLRGDFGWSKSGSDTIAHIISRRFPATLELALWAIIPIIGVGIWMGVLAAVNHNKLIDQILRVFSIVGTSVPLFVFGLVALMIFYAKLQWFPPGRLTDWANAIVTGGDFVRYTSMNTFYALLNGRL